MADNKRKKTENSDQATGPAAVETPVEPEALMEEETEAGTIRISESVISAVVRRYALEVQGVIRFATGRFAGGLGEMIGKKASGVVVDLEEDAVNISVSVVLEFGVRIPEVAAMVQEIIRSKVNELTGKHVNRVDVVVQDLEDVAGTGDSELGVTAE